MVLCLHDFADFWYGWRNQLRGLGESFRVISLDLKGYGDSDKPWLPFSYRDDVILKELRGLVEALQPSCSGRKIILVGHGFGGSLAWKFTERYPELVDRLIVISAPHPDIWRHNVTASWRNILTQRWLYMCRLPFLAERKLVTHSHKLFEKRFKNRESQSDLVCCLLTQSEQIANSESYFQDVYRYTFSLFSDWTGPINYYRNLTLSDYGHDQADVLLSSKKMSSKVETLIIVGNNDTDVSLDLITKSAEIHERYKKCIPIILKDKHIDNIGIRQIYRTISSSSDSDLVTSPLT